MKFFVRKEFDSGNIYHGHMKDGDIHGKGKLIFTNGDIYRGNFENGQMHGKGGATIASRTQWVEGNFINGKKEGDFLVYCID